ncbi:hypothetical protein V494_00352 [Pseudogymnoascus sp. VKM F-4513 (FW-928)]|nr:hypothetical protein V494_00352 [Pseudogymnoascus sp. VKM F-4513 (FW-928)]
MYSYVQSYFLLAFPLLSAAATASFSPTAPNNGAILDILESQGYANWIPDAEGLGKSSYFSNEVWEAAEAEAVANLNNSTSPHRRGLIQLRNDGELPDGVSDSGGTRHAAHWWCYGSGSALYNIAVPIATVPLCASAAGALEAVQTGHWIWTREVRGDEENQIDPTNTSRRVILKLAKYAGMLFKVTLCNDVLVQVINTNCKAPERKRQTITHGGHVDIYEGKVNDWDQGDLAMQFSVSIENV